MNREIKFRAWDAEKQVMRDDFIIYNGWPCFVEIDASFVPLDWPLVQYTGLKDMDGKEIYEGDIYHMGDPKIIYVVVWHDTGLIGRQEGTKSSYAGITHWQDKINIIGNIYKNPELLKVRNESV
jgi:uncharacterized phage protein (TIGR01671 family)